MSGYVYLYRSRTERKVYIGQTMQVHGERWTQHLVAAYCGSTLDFHQAIRRFGPSDFSEEILAEAKTRTELNKLEREFIEQFKSTDPNFGYNMRAGNRGEPLLDAVTLNRYPGKRMSVTLGQSEKGTHEDALLPLYNCYGQFLGYIPFAKAREFDGQYLTLKVKGTGRQRRFTSAKMYARELMKWAPRSSAGFTVMQLIRE
jgi:hypothetical protein